MEKDSGQVVQAVPLIVGKINVGAGDYVANNVIHCEADGSILLYDGVTTYPFVAGMDRCYNGKFTVVTGLFTYD